MGGFLSLPILFLAAIMQATLAPQISIQNGRPDFVFLLVLAWSVSASLEEGVIWCFVGGILLDLLSAAPLGTSTMGLLIVVFGVNTLKNQVYRVGVIMLVWVVIAGTVVQIITQMIILSAVGYPLQFLNSFPTVILPTLFYNLIFILPCYWVVRRIQRRIAGPGHVFY